MAMINSIPQGGKYTQGFVFGHDQIKGEYSRAVVERTCAAVVTLLQDVFALAEKNVFQQAMETDSIREQNRIFRRLIDMIRYRPLMEKSLVTAVTCVYVEIANAEVRNMDNAAQMERRIVELEQLRCERLDLLALFDIGSIRDQATDRTRPLLLDFSAQLNSLFLGETGKVASHPLHGNPLPSNPLSCNPLSCNPLSPATLISGFMTGLLCAEMDILAKQMLFRTFEQEFLSKLSVLLNSVVLRLEQENTFVKQVVGFNDSSAGPIERVLRNPLTLPLPELQQAIDAMHVSLSSHKSFTVAQDLYELSGEDAIDSTINLLSDVHYYHAGMQSSVARAATHIAETAVLVNARNTIAERLNTAFAGRKMPASIKVFFQTLWPDVLLEILMASGEASEIWHEAIPLQQLLLESVTPANDADKLASLNRTIPMVVRSLRKLLDETGCRFEDTTTFLGELKLLHLQNMQQQLNLDSFVRWEVLSMRDLSPSVVNILDEDEKVCYGQMQDIISLLNNIHGEHAD